MPKGATVELTPEQKAAKVAARQAEKAAKFIEIASKRMTKALDAIELLGNLANKSSYSWTNDQINAMGGALGDKVNGVLSLFAKPESAKAATGFSFPTPEKVEVEKTAGE